MTDLDRQRHTYSVQKNDLDTTVLSNTPIPITEKEVALAVGFVVTQQIKNKKEAKFILGVLDLVELLQGIREEQKRG